MKINIIKLTPKNWKITNKKNKIELYYVNDKPQHSPKKSFTFHRIILLDEGFYEGLGLYLGDGDMNRKEKGHLTFCSKDKDIALNALNFLKRYFNIKIKDITFTVQYNQKNKKLKYEWSKYLNIPRSRISTRHSKRHRCEVIHIQANGVVFRKTFELVIKEALSKKFINNKKLRRAILRGLFAAEGNIGIDYIENKPYVSQISFNLNIKEKQIRSIISRILKREGITFRLSPRYENNSFEIIISNWQNYYKLYKIDTFNLCKRKKDKFFNIMKNLKVYPSIDIKTKDLLFGSLNLNQKEIARIINSYQGNISKIKHGIIKMTLEQMEMLRKKTKIRKSYLKNNITSLRIGNLTSISDNSFIDLMFKLKANR